MSSSLEMVRVKTLDSLTRTCQTRRHRVSASDLTNKFISAEQVQMHAHPRVGYFANSSRDWYLTCNLPGTSSD